MAPVEFEKDLQKRIQDREMKPGRHVWKKIEARLEHNGHVSKRYPRLWIGFAAACVVLLFGYLFLWESPQALPLVEPVAETPVETPVKLNTDPSPSTERAFIAPPEGLVERRQQEPTYTETGVPVKNAETNAAAMQTEVAEIPKDKVPSEVDVTKLSGLQVNQLDSLKTGLATLNGESSGVSEGEIDSLLRSAMDSYALQRETKADTTIDAMALLNEVEMELDQTFRGQILEKLKTGFEKVRTSVADRNK